MKLFPTNSSIIRLWDLNAKFACSVHAGARVLDAGAGEAPYRSLFAHTIYETADFEKVDKKYSEQTYTCDLANVPVPSEYFDAIICNQVLEHLPNPSEVLKEFNRILKVGGKILCSCPFYFEEHEQPYDFYRYTQFGLQHLFTEAGFEVTSLEWLEGYLGTVGHQLRRIGKSLPLLDVRALRTPIGIAGLPALMLVKLTAVICARVIGALDIHMRITDRGHPINYIVIGSKIRRWPPE
jgi:SAM-dependent methyltransferase